MFVMMPRCGSSIFDRSLACFLALLASLLCLHSFEAFEALFDLTQSRINT